MNLYYIRCGANTDIRFIDGMELLTLSINRIVLEEYGKIQGQDFLTFFGYGCCHIKQMDNKMNQQKIQENDQSCLSYQTNEQEEEPTEYPRSKKMTKLHVISKK